MARSAKVVPLKRAKRTRKSPVSGTVPNRIANDALRTRSHLTEAEVKKLLKVGQLPFANAGYRVQAIVNASEDMIRGGQGAVRKVGKGAALSSTARPALPITALPGVASCLR